MTDTFDTFNDILKTLVGCLKDEVTTFVLSQGQNYPGNENTRATWSNQTIPVIEGVKAAWKMV